MLSSFVGFTRGYRISKSRAAQFQAKCNSQNPAPRAHGRPAGALFIAAGAESGAARAEARRHIAQ